MGSSSRGSYVYTTATATDGDVSGPLSSVDCTRPTTSITTNVAHPFQIKPSTADDALLDDTQFPMIPRGSKNTLYTYIYYDVTIRNNVSNECDTQINSYGGGQMLTYNC